MNRRRFLAVEAGLALAGRASPAPSVVWRGAALGAAVSITLGGGAARAAAALDAARAEIAEAERLFSLWRDDSVLARLNRDRRASGAPAFARLVAEALAASRASEGFFDPTVQPLWRAIAGGAGPAAAAAARALIGADRVAVDGDAVTLAPGAALTLNGIAQGWAADRVAWALAGFGYRDALVDMGEFAGRGRRPDGGPWRVGVAHPWTGAVVATLTLAGRAAATSAPFATRIGRAEGAHILDPVGAPGARLASVTVVAASAARADALSTAVAAAPARMAEALLRAGGAEEAVLVDADGRVRHARL
jgi:thiamine biosynthesis lipoprotein